MQTNKMGGDMEVNKNKFIEDWGTVRENLEDNFRWTRRNLAIVGIFGVVIPYLVYKGSVREFASLYTFCLLLYEYMFRVCCFRCELVMLS
ncbi:putative NADH:ubiquinone reductase (H(+)-translocating) [Helianthus anomalus]